MAESEKRLLSLLFEEGRVTDNLKFFPGPECGSAEDLFEAAHSAITAAFAGESTQTFPQNGAEQVSIGELARSF